MKARSIIVAVAVCCLAVSICSAQSAHMGTWKLNESKSNLPAGVTKNTSVAYEAAGDKIKVTVDGVDGSGKPVHSEWTGKFDGKDYPVTGDALSTTRSYKMINDHAMELTNKKDGKVTMSGRIELSADGKSRTVTVSGTNPSGAKVNYSAVYDKQ